MISYKSTLLYLATGATILGLSARYVSADNLADESLTNKNIPSPDETAVEAPPKTAQKINLTIQIAVPHNTNAVESCRIFPYPVAPVRMKGEIEKLPIKDKALRSQLLTMGYSNKGRQDKPFPTGGWRMQNALQAAVKNSGLGMPHSIFTEYAWAENMIPYLRKEIRVINAKELERRQRYDQVQTLFNENRADLEVQSFNQGLYPIDVPIRRERGGFRQGRLVVDKANWWIVAMHKVPGLKYYWLWPVKLGEAPDQRVVLDEDNAIYIEGAW